MFTNNFKKVLKCMFCVRGMPGFNLVSYNGEMVACDASALRCVSFESIQCRVGGISTGIVLGTNNSPATREDYKVDPVPHGETTLLITNGITSEGFAFAQASIAYSNTGASPVTISEIGLFGGAGIYLTPFLVDRTLLDSPVVVAAGESCGIKYTLTNQFAYL